MNNLDKLIDAQMVLEREEAIQARCNRMIGLLQGIRDGREFPQERAEDAVRVMREARELQSELARRTG